MADDAPQTVEEMAANLAGYKEQLAQVRPSTTPRPPRILPVLNSATLLTRPSSPPSPRPQVEQLLAAEPDNAEYLDVKTSLAEVIALTEDLVASAGAADAPAQPTPEAEAPSAPPAAPPPPPPPPIAASVAGAPCQARYDGTWYEAVMEEVLADGRVRVRFPAYGTVADVGTRRPSRSLRSRSRGGGGGRSWGWGSHRGSHRGGERCSHRCG